MADRRLNLVVLLVPLVALPLCPPSAVGQDSKSAKKTRILFIGKEPDHPWGSHMYLHASKVLARCAERSGNVETVVASRWPKDPAPLRQVDTIIPSAVAGRTRRFVTNSI